MRHAHAATVLTVTILALLASTVYSLGPVLYYLLTGSAPDITGNEVTIYDVPVQQPPLFYVFTFLVVNTTSACFLHASVPMCGIANAEPYPHVPYDVLTYATKDGIGYDIVSNTIMFIVSPFSISDIESIAYHYYPLFNESHYIGYVKLYTIFESPEAVCAVDTLYASVQVDIVANTTVNETISETVYDVNISVARYGIVTIWVENGDAEQLALMFANMLLNLNIEEYPTCSAVNATGLILESSGSRIGDVLLTPYAVQLHVYGNVTAGDRIVAYSEWGGIRAKLVDIPVSRSGPVSFTVNYTVVR